MFLQNFIKNQMVMKILMPKRLMSSSPFVTNKYQYESEVKGVLAKMSRVT